MQRLIRARQPAGLDEARGGQRWTLEEGEKGGAWLALWVPVRRR